MVLSSSETFNTGLKNEMPYLVCSNKQMSFFAKYSFLHIVLTFFCELKRVLLPWTQKLIESMLLNRHAIQKQSRHVYTMIADASLNITANTQHT
jgi:hypothetical protein